MTIKQLTVVDIVAKGFAYVYILLLKAFLLSVYIFL